MPTSIICCSFGKSNILLDNLIESIRRVNLIDRLVLYPLDSNTYDKYSSIVPCRVLKNVVSEEASDDYVGYGASKFKDITLFKNRIMQDSLRRGDTTLLVDTDIVFLKSPEEYLMQLGNKHEVLFQIETYFNKQKRRWLKTEVNTGFIWAKPTKNIIKLFDYNRGDEHGTKTQQFLINWRLKTFKTRRWYPNIPSIPSDTEIRYDRLKLEEFPTWVSWQNMKNKTREQSYVLHYNDTSYLDTKIGRMKQQGHWLL
jgi:hypothetical protein